MFINVLKTTSPATGRKFVEGAEVQTHEEGAEIHACIRMHQRYGVPMEMTAEIMLEHLAMILAGETLRCKTQLDPKHYGTEVHKILYRQQRFFAIYDPSIMRIVTYLPNNANTRRLARNGR